MVNPDTSSGNEAPEHTRAAANKETSNVHGDIPGIPVGKTWPSRLACSLDNVHRPRPGGIHGNQKDGAFSIVLSVSFAPTLSRYLGWATGRAAIAT